MRSPFAVGSRYEVRVIADAKLARQMNVYDTCQDLLVSWRCSYGSVLSNSLNLNNTQNHPEA